MREVKEEVDVAARVGPVELVVEWRSEPEVAAGAKVAGPFDIISILAAKIGLSSIWYS